MARLSLTPLINVEEGNPFNSVAGIRQNIQKMGQNGIRFVRWFPTGEGANYGVIPFGDSMRMSWRFGRRHRRSMTSTRPPASCSASNPTTTAPRRCLHCPARAIA